MTEHQPTGTPGEDVDFTSFLAQVRDYEKDASEVRLTAHSTSIATSDWQKIKDSLGDSPA